MLRRTHPSPLYAGVDRQANLDRLGDPLDPGRSKITIGAEEFDATEALVAELARLIGGPAAEARARRREL
jgi:hypothetical protein